jgi:hypothetical protein
MRVLGWRGWGTHNQIEPRVDVKTFLRRLERLWLGDAVQ